MQKTIGSLISLMICVAIFSSCSSVETIKSDTIEQRLIFQQYFIQYNANDSTIEATAQFNVNNGAGASLKLTGKSCVTYNDEELKGTSNKSENTFQYTLHSDGALPQHSSFTYMNNDNQKFVNNIPVNRIELKAAKSVLSKTAKNTLAFNGQPLGDNETLECVITLRSNDENKYNFQCYQDTENPHMIVIFGEDIDAPTGEYEMQFIRRNSSSEINAMERGGLWETEYLTKKTLVDIIE